MSQANSDEWGSVPLGARPHASPARPRGRGGRRHSPASGRRGARSGSCRHRPGARGGDRGGAGSRRSGPDYSERARSSGQAGSSSACSGRPIPVFRGGSEPQRHRALASYGDTDVFLPADAESDVTARLRLGAFEVLKVAHHGSADPGLDDAAARPATADRGDLRRAEQRLRASARRDPRRARHGSRARRLPHGHPPPRVVESDGRSIRVRTDGG